ncbi:MAG: sugar phosphate isomerase/epimerase family protein [Planctomycetota bacterium]
MGDGRDAKVLFGRERRKAPSSPNTTRPNAMPRFGICGTPDKADLATEAGFDYVELPAGRLLDPRADDTESHLQTLRGLGNRARIFNIFMPGDLVVTGPDRDEAALQTYLAGLFDNLHELVAETIVFGSGKARMVRDGQSRDEAWQQITDLLQMAAPHAERSGAMIVIEPLRSAECNILNTVDEAMRMVRQLDHPHVQCLVDSYHLWEEDEAVDHIVEAGGAIRHVHVADPGTRASPGLDRTHDDRYDAFFRALHTIGYDSAISVEGRSDWQPDELAATRSFLEKAWTDAAS